MQQSGCRTSPPTMAWLHSLSSRTMLVFYIVQGKPFHVNKMSVASRFQAAEGSRPYKWGTSAPRSLQNLNGSKSVRCYIRISPWMRILHRDHGRNQVLLWRVCRAEVSSASIAGLVVDRTFLPLPSAHRSLPVRVSASILFHRLSETPLITTVSLRLLFSKRPSIRFRKCITSRFSINIIIR